MGSVAMRRLRFAAFVSWVTLSGRVAWAQSCHVAPANTEDATGVQVLAREETAGFRTDHDEGHYEGLFVGVVFASEAFSGSVTLPAYHLVHDELASTGLGDIPIAARARLLELDGERASAGVALSVTVPSGSAEDELGMGHVMLMPGIWGLKSFGPLTLQVDLAYGRALAPDESDTPDGEHAHHHGATEERPDGMGPLVDPMNRSELQPLVTALVDFADPLAARGGAYAGFPTASDGTSRAVAFLGLELTQGSFGARVQGELPFIGDPFTAKLVLELSWWL